jgi:transposase InsO family protein
LLVVVRRQHPEAELPAASAVGTILKKYGWLVDCAGCVEAPLQGRLAPYDAANRVWCADFKGHFRLGNHRYCYPLTITDQFSRFLVACEARENTKCEGAIEVFEQAFRAYGLPLIIRSDNGVPFATTGLAQLSKLSVWWLRLGVRPERIEPAHPEQNGQHERMHRTLKRETTRPAGRNELEQQERFDQFIDEFNRERPHEAIGLKPPATLYVPSPRAFPSVLPEPQYPLHDDVLVVKPSGHLSLGGRGNNFFLSLALASQPVGVREEDDGRWLVSFSDLDLVRIDIGQGRVEPIAV